MTDTELALAAHRLALKHISRDVRRGYTEEQIKDGYFGSGRSDDAEFGEYDVSVGGWIVGVRNVGNDHVLVRRVHGVDVNLTFKLHDLYVELKSGQQSLL